MLSFEGIAKMTQKELKKALTRELKLMGYKPLNKDGFVYAEGKLPIMLVAHLDTVHKNTVKTICYSSNGKIIMSPEGIGGDDRCGVYMILQIIRKQKCHVVFCEDEEVGGIGAGKFAESGIKPDINYMIELDRRGNNDAVFYDCDNPDFTNFIVEHGFEEEFGSFSDISTIAPALGIAAVNISAGYYNEHTRHEYVDTQVMRENIKCITKMITSQTGKFEYIEGFSYGRYGRYSKYYDRLSPYYDEYGYDDYGYYPTKKTITKSANTDIISIGTDTKSAKKEASSSVFFELLMPLPESHYVRTRDGEMLQDDDYYIDVNGTVYKYLFEYDVAIEAVDYTAHNENALPSKFVYEDAEEMEIAAEDYAQEILDLLCG